MGKAWLPSVPFVGSHMIPCVCRILDGGVFPNCRGKGSPVCPWWDLKPIHVFVGFLTYTYFPIVVVKAAHCALPITLIQELSPEHSQVTRQNVTLSFIIIMLLELKI